MQTTSVEQMVFRVAGGMVLASALLAALHSLHWLWLTAFVGGNMIQASFTGFCPMAKILKVFGLQGGAFFG
jgi:hypothetical protein